MRIPGFYRMPPEARLSTIEEIAHLGADERDAYRAGLTLDAADAMIENVIGTFALPCAVAVNLLINGRDRLVPMVVEEPSVVAAVSNMARLTRLAGGIHTSADESVMIGQVQIHGIADLDAAAARLTGALDYLASLCKGVHTRLEERGGGFRGFEVRKLVYDEPGYPPEPMLVLHFFLDCVDAMGANMINTLAERLAPEVVAITGGQVGLRILSNLADRRLARARVRLRPEHLDDGDINGEDVALAISNAWKFAWADPYRAATHNKGIMNGIDAVAIATGNDWRAIEAGAHAFAAHTGQYRPLSSWRLDHEKTLIGELELPVQVGTVGGPIKVHPTVQSNLKVAQVTGARDLAMVMAAVGLAQNLAALRALATEGIQEGHMRMHARTVALSAGAVGAEIGAVVAQLVVAHDFSVDRAKTILANLRGP